MPISLASWPGEAGFSSCKLDANAVRLFDHVAVGDDVALGIHNDARTERALADGARIGPP